VFRIHWHRNGTFDRSFGGPGFGPGEFLNPVQIYVRDAVYVWDQGKIHTFARDGRYLRSIPVAVLKPKRFLADGDSFLLGYREMERGAVRVASQRPEGSPDQSPGPAEGPKVRTLGLGNDGF